MTPILHRQPRTSATLILAGAVLYFVLGVFIMGARNAPQADRYENVITAIQPMPASTVAMEVMEGEEDETTNQHHTSVSLRSYPVLISTDVEDLPNSFGTVLSLPGYSPRTLLALHQRLLI